MHHHYNAIVVGAGSGGIGAALAAARAGLDVLLVEAAPTIGGTAVRAGVSIWEMGVGGTGLPFEIYRHLRVQPGAVGIYTIGRHCLWPGPDEPAPYPGGELRLDPSLRYVHTLRRHGARSMRDDQHFVRAHWHGVVFEPAAYARVVHRLLTESRHCTIRCGTTLTAVHTDAGHVQSLTLSDGSTVTAGAYVDATGDVALARACGAATHLGQEARAAFDEPGAPPEPMPYLNGATLIYRVTPSPHRTVDPLPRDMPVSCWWHDSFPAASIAQMPRGGLLVNMLPTLAGREALDLGPRAAYGEARRRVLAHWHHLQTRYPEFLDYHLDWIAPALGIRESWRIAGEATLTEHDLLSGLSGQTHPDVIALSDHALDTHGKPPADAGRGELREPYGIPYRCLIPQGFRNLLVACRGAGFSALAASSCRLSRTMMQLGQAAGTAIALAHARGIDLPDVPAGALRDHLWAQHVQLEHPMPAELMRFLERES